ncbi:MAG: hypothetical protein JNM33_10895, partial [Rubrivivax sp.]|nr:hypothetical protein [Rubrivivax sp.]
GFVAGDDVAVALPPGGLNSGTVANKNVGNGKLVTIAGLSLSGNDAANYSIDAAGSGLTVNITPRLLNAVYVGGSRAYDGSIAAPVTASSADLITGDAVTFSQSAVFTGLNARNVGTGKPISVTGITIAGTDAVNYSLASNTASTTGDITSKGVTVSYTALGRVYNGLADTSVTVTGSSTDLVPGDAVDFTQTAAVRGDGAAGLGRTVDVSNISLTGAQAANYTLASTTATTTVNIAQRAIGVSGINAVDRAYDGTTTVAINVAGAAVNSASIVAADVGQVQVELPPSGISSGTVATKDVGQNKQVSVTGLSITGAAAANYTVAGATGITVNITPREISAAYNAANKVYDGNATAQVTATSDGILAGDVGALGITATGQFATGKNAGSGLTVNVTGGFLTGVERNNYALTNPTGTATANITPRQLTPTYSGGSRVYDGTDAAPVTSTTAGVVNGDELLFGQTAVFSGGKNVGNGKAISVSGIVLAGADAANYSLASTTASASGSITAKPITVSGLSSVVASNRVYDGTNVVTVTIPDGVTLVADSSDIIAGDQVAIGVPSAGTTTGTMVDKNAGNNKQVAITGLTLSGTDAGNYVVAGAAGVTVNIARKDLTAVYTGVTRTYDGGVGATVTGTSGDLIAGDSLLITGDGIFTGTGARNAGTGKTIQVTSAQLGGTDRNNYTLLNPTGTATGTVIPRQLTPGYLAYSRVYDGTNIATLTATEAGVVVGDDLEFSQTAVFTGAGAKNVGNGKSISVTGISLSGADAANYSLASTSATTSGSITPRSVTLTGLSGVQAVDRTYNGTTTVTVNLQTTGNVTPTPGDILDGDVVTVNVPVGNVTTGSMANKNAGSGKSVVSIAGLGLSGADAANYTLVGTTGVTVNIAQLSLTAVYTGGSRVYDGGVTAPVTGSSSDILAGDVVGFGINAQFTGSGAKNVGSGKAISVLGATLNGSDAANYALVNATGQTTGSITPKTVSVAYVGGTRVYDGTVSAPVSSSIVGLVTGDAVTASATAVFTGASAKNVGSGKAISVTGIQLAGDDSVNYALAADTASALGSITPRPLRVQGLDGISATDRVYDGTTTVSVNVNASGPLTLNSQDVIAGDDLTLNAPPNGTTTGTMADKNVGTNKSVTVAGLTLSGVDAGNYSIGAAGGVTVNITPRELLASYSGVTRVYDGTVAASVTGSTSDLISGDIVSIVGSGIFTGAGARNAGTGKPIDVTSAALAGADAANYLLTNPTGTATGSITQRLVTALYSGGTRVYDGSTAAPVTGSVAGLINGDAVSLSATAAFTGPGAKNVGSGKAVSITGITLSGDDAANYVLAADAASTTASITPKPLRVDGLTGIAATDRAYDGTTTVAVSVQASGTLTPNSADLVAGDVVTVSLPGGSASTGTMADKHVGQNKAVTVGGIVLGGDDGANYSVSAALGLTVNISPRLLTATWVGIDRVYDGTALAQVAGSSADIVAGDLLGITGSGSFAGGKNVGVGKTIDISGGALTGADRLNYTLGNPTGTATASITPRPLTPTYTGGSRVYDGSTTALVTAGDFGLVSGDSVTLTQTAAFTGAGAKNVGTGKTIAIDGITLGGTDAGNYTLLATTATTTGSITPRPVSVSGLSNLSAVDRVYDGTRNVQIVTSGATGGSAGSSDFLAGDDVSVVVPGGGLGAGLMVDKNVGSNKAVAISGLSLAGSDAANYLITGTAGVTVNITPRPATLLGLAAVDRIYDGTLTVAINASGASLTGLLAGDDVTLGAVAGSGTMADKHVGSGKPVSFQALQLAGADAANYAFSAPTLSVNITPRPFTATITVADKIYDGTTNASATLTTTGLVAGDQVTLAGGSDIRFADKNVGAGKTVSATGLSLAGLDAGDYLLTSGTASATASITPASLTLAFAGGDVSGTLSKVYGETLNFAGTEFSAQGLVAGETLGQVTLTSAGASATASVNGGPYAITLSDARGGTFDPRNYNLIYGSGTIVVTPRPLTLTGPLVTRFADEQNPPYVNTLSLEGIAVSAGGLASGDQLLGALLTAPGSEGAKGVSVFDLVPSGARFAPGVDASNYTLRYINGLLIVLPTPPRIGDVDNGGGGATDVGVAVDQVRLERALAELERVRGVPWLPGVPGVDLLQRAAEEEGDITVVLSGDAGRITLRELLKLPLLSFDPVLRRLIFGPAAETRR